MVIRQVDEIMGGKLRVKFLFEYEGISKPGTECDETIQALGDVVVLRCAGRIVGCRESDILRLAAVSQTRVRTVVLDLAAVEAIDAGGLGLLVFLHTCAYGLGSELKLMNPTQRVAELLRLTNLDSVFEIFSSENVVSHHATVVRATDETAACHTD